MIKKSLLLGAIASVLTLNAFAETTTSTIPTQSYVDTNFQTKIPAGSFGANNSVVTYDANSGSVQERLVLHPMDGVSREALKGDIVRGDFFDEGTGDGWALDLVEIATEQQLKDAIVPAEYIVHGFKYKQYAITPGTTGSVAIFNGADSRGGSQFTEKAISNSAAYNNGTLTNGDNIASISAVETKQNKMTCTQWLGDEHTDANCLLWSIN